MPMFTLEELTKSKIIEGDRLAIIMEMLEPTDTRALFLGLWLA